MKKRNSIIVIVLVMFCMFFASSANVKAQEEYTLEDMREYIISEMNNMAPGIDVSHFGDVRVFKSRIDIQLFLKECKSDVIWTGAIPLFYSDYSEATGEYTLNVVRPRYVCTKQNVEDAVKAADKLLEGIKGNDNLTDVEKALLIHDRLIVSCEYDEMYYNINPDTIPAISHSGYAVLTKNIAVCDGYAAAYKYLLEQVGIKSEICSSEALRHAWNIVYIDDIPYHVDVTWDDPMADTEGYVSHDNFLVSSKKLYRTGHKADDYNTLPADTTYDDYFWRDSSAEFQLLDDKIYYINNVEQTLNEWDGDAHTKLHKIKDNWGDFPKIENFNYSTLSNDGEKLLYSLTDAIYSYDVNTGKSEIVYQPQVLADGTSTDKIYGFSYENGEFICDISELALIYREANLQRMTPIARLFLIGVVVLIVIIVVIVIKIVKKIKIKKKALRTDDVNSEKTSEKQDNETQK